MDNVREVIQRKRNEINRLEEDIARLENMVEEPTKLGSIVKVIPSNEDFMARYFVLFASGWYEAFHNGRGPYRWVEICEMGVPMVANFIPLPFASSPGKGGKDAANRNP